MAHPLFARLVAAALVAALHVSAPSRADDNDDVVLRGYYGANGLLQRGHYELAVDEYRAFLAEHGDHDKAPVARYGLGVGLFRLDRTDEAGEALEPLRALRDFPYRAEVLTILSRCDLAHGRAERAAEAAAEIVEHHPDHDLADDAAALEAEALYGLGAHERVEAIARLVAERWPTSPLRDRVELFAGLSEMARGAYDRAADRFEAFGTAYPDSPHVARVRLLGAQSLHHSGRSARAIERYRAVVKTGADADAAEARYGLAVLLHQGGQAAQLEEAARLLDEVLAGDPAHARAPDARLLRGRLDVERGAYASGRRTLQPLLSAAAPGSPGFPPATHRDEAVYWTAKSHMREGADATAADLLEDALRRDPKSRLRTEMLYDLAVALLRSDRPEDALVALRTLRTESPTHPLAADALYLVASTHHRLGDWTACLKDCRAFLDRHAEHEQAPAVAFLAAESRFLSGDHAAAAEAFLAIVDGPADNPQREAARFRLGMALYHLARYEDAEEHLASFSNPAPESPYRAAVLALGDIAFQRGDWAAAEPHLARYLNAPAPPAAADDALLKLGLARHRQHRLEPALAAYDRLLDGFADSPHRLQALFERGQALVALRRDDDAADAFQAVLEAGDGTRFGPYALEHLGAIALNAGRFDDAADLYGRAARRAAADERLAAEASFQRGQALASAGRLDDAERALAAFVESFPRSARVPSARAHRAIALSRLDRDEDALAAMAPLGTGADLDPALAGAVLYEKAWCLRGLGRPDEAADAYRALIGSPGAPLLAHARLELAELETNAKHPAVAADLLRLVLADPGAGADVLRLALYRLGACEYTLEHFAPAADLLGRYADEHPTDDLAPTAALLAGEALHRSGAHQRAAERLERLLAARPVDAVAQPALLRLGESLAAIQGWAKAGEAFGQHRRRFPDSELWFQAQFGVAWCQENEGRFDDAIAAYRPVTERHRGPTAARAQFQIGECMYAQRRFEEAARELLKVDILYAYPEWSAGALFEAGRCFEELGRTVEARRQFEEVRTKHPETKWAGLASARLEELSRVALPGK